MLADRCVHDSSYLTWDLYYFEDVCGDDVRLQSLCFVRCDHDDDALLYY